MNGKLEFGCDYLNIMRCLEMKGKPESFDPIADAAIRLFLLNWGFSVSEIDESNKLFWDRYNANQLEPDLYKVITRIIDHIKDDRMAKERFVIEMAAIGFMDMNVNDDESNFVNFFKDYLDLKFSEFNTLCNKGMDLAVGLNFFGNEYKRNFKPTE